MGSPRERHTATLLNDGKVLVVGGYPSSGTSAEPSGPTITSPWRERTRQPEGSSAISEDDIDLICWMALSAEDAPGRSETLADDG